MIDKLKTQADAFRELPLPLKSLIFGALVFLAVFVAYFAGTNYFNSRRVEKLEKENVELNKKAESALDRMGRAQTQAANEKLRADNLETNLRVLDAQSQKQDETVTKSRKTVAASRSDLDALRRREPKRADADALERRLKARYGQTGNPRPGQ